MVTVPAFLAVTTPFDTVAMLLSLVVHVTARSSGFKVGVIVAVVPSFNSRVSLSMLMVGNVSNRSQFHLLPLF